MEVFMNGFRGCNVLILVYNLFPCADGGGEQRRYIALTFKDEHHTFVSWSLSLAVAPSRSLKNGIQTGHFPVHRRKIHINAGLNERGRYYPGRASPDLDDDESLITAAYGEQGT